MIYKKQAGCSEYLKVPGVTNNVYIIHYDSKQHQVRQSLVTTGQLQLTAEKTTSSL